jgi:hypothetical protein
MVRADEDDNEKVFGSPARRHVLGTILASDGPTELESLSARLAAETAPDGLTARRHATMLHHVHLPVLAAAGLVEWTPGEGTIAPTARARGLVTRDTVAVSDIEGASDD